MAGHNSILPNDKGSLEEVADAIGSTKFNSLTGWHQIIGGLSIQGDYVTAVGAGATLPISFNASYEKQILGVFCQPANAGLTDWRIDNVTQDGFDLVNGPTARDFYWWAIGV